MNRRQFASTLGAIIALPRTSQTAITSQRTAARSLVGPLAIPQTRATLSDVKHASIADGMALACTMMGNVFNTDDNEIPETARLSVDSHHRSLPASKWRWVVVGICLYPFHGLDSILA